MFFPLLLDVLLVVHFCCVEVPHHSLVGKPEDLVGLLVIRDWNPKFPRVQLGQRARKAFLLRAGEQCFVLGPLNSGSSMIC